MASATGVAFHSTAFFFMSSAMKSPSLIQTYGTPWAIKARLAAARRPSAGIVDSSGVPLTVIACFPDMQGRLIGKRFDADFFLGGAYEETHGCDYLLADDIDMEPVPGYAAANWEKGYGDFIMKPDLGTLRRTPWLPATALVLCDILDHHHHEPVPHGPRAILRRQVARLADMNMSAYFASELEFYLFDETYESAAAKGLRGYSS